MSDRLTEVHQPHLPRRDAQPSAHWWYSGLLRMRERVTALGGRLRVAPRAEGGFSVHAELPVGETVDHAT